MHTLRKAIEKLNGVGRLAHELGIRQSAVSNWLARGNVPADRAPAIEAATGGEIRCEDLRPDLTWERDAHGRVVAYRVPVPTSEAA